MAGAVVTRRGFVGGLGALFMCAPAIVRAASIMPVSAKALATLTTTEGTFEITGFATTWWASQFDGVSRDECQQWEFDGSWWGPEHREHEGRNWMAIRREIAEGGEI
jgi:hypothetical protein